MTANGNVKDMAVGPCHRQTARPGYLVSTAMDTPLSLAATRSLELAGQVGTRHEFDHNRDNPGCTKDLFIDNAPPEPTPAGASGSDTNKNFDAATHRSMCAGENVFQSGKPSVLTEYDVTLPGFLVSAKNDSKKVAQSRGGRVHLGDVDCGTMPDSIVGAYVFQAKRAMAYLRVSTCASAPDVRQVTFDSF